MNGRLEAEKQYLEITKQIYYGGQNRSDRTKVGTRSIFAPRMTFNVGDTLPLLTTKKVWYKGVLSELLWFIRGETDLQPLLSDGVSIWTEWAYEKYQNNLFLGVESEELTIEEFEGKIIEDDVFNKEYSLGPVYGKQWRDFGGVDQLQSCINLINNKPHSRRILVSAWNPPEMKYMALPPCHIMYQFYVREMGDIDKKIYPNEKNQVLDIMVYQRSADWFLGVPFNLASYSTLLKIVAKLTDKLPGRMIYNVGDAHIYKNHFEQVSEMLSRESMDDVYPILEISDELTSLDSVHPSQFALKGYKSHSSIKAPIAV